MGHGLSLERSVCMDISRNSLFVVSSSLVRTAVVMAALGGCSDRGTGETGASDVGSTTGTTGSSSETGGETGVPTTGPADPSTTTGEPASTSTGELLTTGESSTTEVDPTTTTGPDPFCGDGTVDDGEVCDDGNQDDADACTNACQTAVCGDGIVGPGEMCDDGDDDETDECTSKCAPASCGDGVVQAGEDCDDGDQDDSDECLSTCALAVCGDGAVQAGVEGCDDGDQDDSDECLANCTPAACGDGVLHVGVEGCDDGDIDNSDDCLSSCVTAICGDGQVHFDVEACDDGNNIDGDGCNNDCTASLPHRFVFVTSTLHTGELGGLAGADAICNERAAAGGLTGTYMAWLSDDTGSPSTRMVQSLVPYVLPDLSVVAGSWKDLTDATLGKPINMTEFKLPPPPNNGCGPSAVWTNTNFNGLQSGSQFNCANWTGGNGKSAFGRYNGVDSSWTGACAGNVCKSGMAALYCVQQT
jgi:cysteine-rich repeat protein